MYRMDHTIYSDTFLYICQAPKKELTSKPQLGILKTMRDQNTPQSPIVPSENQPEPEIESSSFPKWQIIIILLVIATLPVGGYFLGKISNNSVPKQTSSPSAKISPTPAAYLTANWKTFKKINYDFEVKYPPNYTISDKRNPDAKTSLQSDYSSIVFRSLTNPALENTKEIIINNFQGYERFLGENMDGDIEFEVLFQNASKNNYLDILFTTNQKGYENKIEEFRKILSTLKLTNQVLPTLKQGVMCPQDAKLCPNGSYVSRTGPNCEFAMCPK